MQAGEALKLLSKRLPMSMREASRRLGRSGNYVYATVSNVSIPRVDTLAAIADLAGVDVCLVDRKTGETIARIDSKTQATD